MLNSTVRIAGVINESIVDGPGLRSTVFLQGCPHVCEGCHNPETWDPNAGKEIMQLDLLRALKLNPLIKGVTFSGGEPFLQAIPMAEFGSYLKKIGYDLWIYTGFTWEYLLSNSHQAGFSQLLEVADVLVDGPFMKQFQTLNLPFRGSSNQRLIKVQASLKSGTIVNWQPRAIA